MDSIPADKVLKKTLLDLQKRFPIYHVCPKKLGGPFLRLGIPRERLSIPPGSGWGGKNESWLATWDCPLRTDSASWKSLESFMQLISFCNSWILPVSSKIVSRSSTSFLIAIVSNVESWNRFNSSISLRLFSWASRRSQFCFNNCSWWSCWSRRSRSSPRWVRQISSFWDSIISFNFWMLLLSKSAWNSCFRISAWQSARICSLYRFRRILTCSLSELWLGISLTFGICESNCFTTGLPVLSWLTDDDWLDDKPSSWEW